METAKEHGEQQGQEFTSWYISFLQQPRRWWMACCLRCSSAMSYCGDYQQRRLLAGHFITVTGREEGEKRERKRREGQKNSKKNTIVAECRGRQRWLVVAGRRNRIIRADEIRLEETNRPHVENTMEQEKHTLKEQEYGFWKDFLSLVKVKNSVWFNMLRKVLSQKSRFIPPVKFPSKCRHRFNKMLRKCAKS